jgi:hypothetical protein
MVLHKHFQIQVLYYVKTNIQLNSVTFNTFLGSNFNWVLTGKLQTTVLTTISTFRVSINKIGYIMLEVQKTSDTPNNFFMINPREHRDLGYH